MRRQGKKDTHFRVELVILITSKDGDLTRRQIEEEIDVMSARLEYKNGEPNIINFAKKIIAGG